VGAIFDGKRGKRTDDAPAEGSKSREPHRKDKRGKKGKKPRREAREQGRDGDDMLKKPCPYHKTPVNHTLEQCDMLKKFYGRAAAKDAEAKKDGGDGDAGGFPAVERVFLIFGGRPSTCRAASVSGSGTRSSPRRRRLPPSLTSRRTPSPSAVKIIRTASLTWASTHWWLTRSLGTRGSQKS
jgi:hypothetical protein